MCEKRKIKFQHNRTRQYQSIPHVICWITLRIFLLFPALHVRPSCKTILQAAYTYVQCSTDSFAPVVLYRLAKHLKFWKGQSFPLLHVRPSCKTILQAAYIIMQCSTDSFASFVLYRSGKCICQIIHLVFPYFTLLNSETTGNGIPKFIYYPLYVHFMHQESEDHHQYCTLQLILNLTPHITSVP